jgi:hypothetical protein
MVTMTPEDLSSNYPVLYHMAEAGSWPMIRKHGLLSTTALLDRCEVAGHDREAIESARRTDSVLISHATFGSATIRDNKPMTDNGLIRSLDGLTPRGWYELLNGMVFFWTRQERLSILKGAEAYRAKRQCILEVNTASLVTEYEDHIRLSPMNSGATRPFAHPRGRNTFLPIERFPFEERRKRVGVRNAVVELTVPYSVPDIANHVLRVYETGGDQPLRELYG